MIKINIVCVGKLKEDFFRLAVAEYLKRLSRFCRAEVIELPEGRRPADEAPAILKRAQGAKIALCVEGKKLSSEGLAALVKGYVDGGRNMSFIIGSSEGLDPSVKAAADVRLSFSDMTFPHQLMRVILCEQLYRAFMINGGGEYHK